MSQLLTFPTRARGDDTPSCIDWVIANTDDIVNDIISQSPLGNSDHVLIECDLNVQQEMRETTEPNYTMTRPIMTGCESLLGQKCRAFQH